MPRKRSGGDEAHCNVREITRIQEPNGAPQSGNPSPSGNPPPPSGNPSPSGNPPPPSGNPPPPPGGPPPPETPTQVAVDAIIKLKSIKDNTSFIKNLLFQQKLFEGSYLSILQNNYKKAGLEQNVINEIYNKIQDYNNVTSFSRTTKKSTSNAIINYIASAAVDPKMPATPPVGGKKKKRQYKKKRGGEEMQPMPAIIPSLPMSQDGGKKKKRQYKKKRGGEDPEGPVPPLEMQDGGKKKKRQYRKKRGGEDPEAPLEMQDGGKKNKRQYKKKRGGEEPIPPATQEGGKKRQSRNKNIASVF